MNITRENSDNVNAVIKILIEKSDYEGPVKEVLKDYRQKATIPGFRPGKVPAGLIEKRFGKAILAEEVNKLLSQNLSKHIVDEKLPLLGEPLPNEDQQKTIDWDNDENFEFVFDVALAPEVQVSLDKKRKFEYVSISVDDEMIDKQIEAVTNQFGENKASEVVEEKSLVRGNFIQLDAEGNELEEGIKPEAVLLAIDKIKDEAIKKDFLSKKVEDIIIFDPVKAFENKTEVGHMLTISPEEAEVLESNFKYTITEVLEFVSAEINEELFKKVYGEETEIKTVEEFREKVKEEIAHNLSYSSDQKFAVDTRNALVDKIKIDLPEAFLKRWLKATNNELTDEQIENDFDSFMKDLKWQLIKDKIIKDNEISITDDEAMDFARQVTFAQFNQYGMHNMPPEQLDSFAKMMLEKPEEKERIFKKLYEDKVMASVKEKTTITDKKVTHEEFSGLMK